MFGVAVPYFSRAQRLGLHDLDLLDSEDGRNTQLSGN